MKRVLTAAALLLSLCQASAAPVAEDERVIIELNQLLDELH